MEKIILTANAKINLTLDITGLRADGYHIMDMIMQSVNLYDTITIKKSAQPFKITTNSRYLPTDRRNSAYKAAEALAEHVGCGLFDCSVHINKIIPSQAGLGGGTADAAAVLFGLNRLYGLSLSTEKLLELAPAIGADVPFCLTGGTARVGGIGETIKPLRPLSGCFFLIAMPHSGNSTRRAFAQYDACPPALHPKTERMSAAIESGDIGSIAPLCCNIFEDIIDTDDSKKLRTDMLANGALAACTTGSGSAIYGIFETRAKADRCRKVIKSTAKSCFIAIPKNFGVEQV